MAGFSSEDNYLSATTQSGQFFKSVWGKQMQPTAAAVTAEWHILARGGGTPTAEALFNTGTNATFQQCNFSTTNNSPIYAGPDVSPMYKYLMSLSGGSAAATTMPCTLMLVDVVGFYRMTSNNITTSQTLTNTLSAFSTFTADAGTDICTHSNINLMPYTRCQLTTTTTLPAGLSLATDYYVIKVSDTTCKFATSYANAVAGTAVDITDAGTGTHTINTLYARYTNGAGVQAICFNNSASAMGTGSAVPTLNSYTNSAQSTGRATPTPYPVAKASASSNHVIYTGAAGTGKYAPFMPLQGTDSGIAKIDNFQYNTTAYSTAGDMSIGLVYPLVEINCSTVGVLTERNCRSLDGGPPRIYDGASLYWLLGSTAATPTNSVFFGTLNFAWN